MSDFDALAMRLRDDAMDALDNLPPEPSPERRLAERALAAATEFLNGVDATEELVVPPWRDGSDHLDGGET